MSEDRYRAAAIKRLKDQRAFKRTLGVFVIVGLLLTAVWGLSGGGYYWPIWAMFGMGIAAAFMAWGAYGPRERPLSEQEIDDETRRMKGQ
jgi:uncharacterized ion transporter superfamily protein YfcC